MHLGSALVVALCVGMATQRSFVDCASLGKAQEPADSESTPPEDGSVKELENLKHSIGKTLELMKTESVEYASEGNDHQGIHTDIKEQVKSDGVTIAKVSHHVDSEAPRGEHSAPVNKLRTEVDIPEQNIHRTIIQESGHNPVITDNGNRRGINPNMNQELANEMNKYNSFSGGVQYSPLDMAEYVFWTGDEKGVTMAIEEFLQEGLMTRDEAITFLQEIKFNLDYLQAHYSQQGLYSQDLTKDRSNSIHKYMRLNKPQLNNRHEDTMHSPYDVSDMRPALSKKSLINVNEDGQELMKPDRAEDEEDYEELLEKLRVADFLYTEYSLEEVIYQLSKIMFTQSLTRGSAEAQAALQKFTNFLETEAEEGHISRALEKKVLDVLIAALTDTLTEHPELVPAAQEGLGGGSSSVPDNNRLLRKLFELNSMKQAMNSYKDQTSSLSGHLNKGQINGNPDKLIPLGFGKYKTP